MPLCGVCEKPVDLNDPPYVGSAKFPPSNTAHWNCAFPLAPVMKDPN
jgi:hypothetical protein